MNKPKPAPGPDPERLELSEDDWGSAVEKALDHDRPEGGWPKHKPREGTGEPDPPHADIPE